MVEEAGEGRENSGYVSHKPGKKHTQQILIIINPNLLIDLQNMIGINMFVFMKPVMD